MESADSFNSWGGSLCWGDEAFPAAVPRQDVNLALKTPPGCGGASSSSCSPGSTLIASHAELQVAATIPGKQAAFGLPADGTAAPEAELGREPPAAVALSTQDILDHEASVDCGMVVQGACNWAGQDSSSMRNNTDSPTPDDARLILIGSSGPPCSSLGLVSGGRDGSVMLDASEGSLHVPFDQAPARRQEEEEEEEEERDDSAMLDASEGSSHARSDQAPARRQEEEAVLHASEGNSTLRYEGPPAVCQEGSLTLRCDEAPARRQEEATLQYEAPALHLEEATLQYSRLDARPRSGVAWQGRERLRDGTGAAPTDGSPDSDGTLPYEATTRPSFMEALGCCGLASHGYICEKKETADQLRTAALDNDTIEYESRSATDPLRQTVMNNETIEYEAWSATNQLRQTMMNDLNDDTIGYETWNATDKRRRNVMGNGTIAYEAGNLRENTRAKSPNSPLACADTPLCQGAGSSQHQHHEQSHQQHCKNPSRLQLLSKDLGAKYATPQKVHRTRDTDENNKPCPSTLHAACAAEVSGQHVSASASASWLVPVKRRRLEKSEIAGARTASLPPRSKAIGMLAPKREPLGESAGCGTGTHKTPAVTRGRGYSSQSSTSSRAARQLTLTEAWRDTKRIASGPVVIHDSLCIDEQ